MSRTTAILIAVTVLVAFSASAAAQETLGDLVMQAGYDSMMGTWKGSDDEGRSCTLEYKWALDKHAITVDVSMGDFRYRGMIMFIPSTQEVIQVGADNMGGTWNGTWDEDYEGVVNRSERLEPDGTKQRMEHVYITVDANTFKVKEYPVEADGWRASSPRGELTFKRQKTK
jgi:hypothetical protein